MPPALALALLLPAGASAIVARGTPCFDSSDAFEPLRSRQQLAHDNATGLFSLVAAPASCLAASAADAPGAPLLVAPCDPADAAQQFALAADRVTLARSSRPLGFRSGGFRANLEVWVVAAGGGDVVAYDANASVLRLAPKGGFNHDAATNLCLALAPAPVAPCEPPSPSAALPFCDGALSAAARVADLVGRVRPDEVAGLLVNGAKGVDRLWLLPHNWWSEALHGVEAGCAEAAPGGAARCPTGFPAALSTAASFNATLFAAVGDAVGREARALYNSGTANGLAFWSPNV